MKGSGSRNWALGACLLACVHATLPASVVCRRAYGKGSVSWHRVTLHCDMLLLSPPCSTAAPDYVNPWVNSFLIAAMAIFGVETLLSFLCRCAV
jgi:hypothetical protein